MPRKRKFMRGPAITDPARAAALILSGVWLYFNDVPKSPKWLRHWSLSLIAIMARHGHLFYALPNKEQP